MAKLYDQVLSKVKIRDVISYYNIPIIKNKIVCPFHDDHEPSMSIDDKRNIAKCFSCGEGGNPITFIYKYEQKVNHNDITFNEAVKIAAEIAKLDIDFSFLDREINDFQYTSNGQKYNDDQKSLLQLNDYFETVYLNELIANEEAQSYVSERGIPLDLVKDMNFGYAPEGIIKRITDRNPNINQYQLEQLGLIQSSSDGKSFSERLANRLIIPIKDEKGNTVAFSGRSLHGEEPKYLHVAESPVFHKSNILYNYNKAKTYAYQDNIYIVEGYMDVVGAKMMGIDNVVALMGKEITDEHIALLKKCNCKLTLALDNDQAGKDAMIKYIPRLMEEGFNLDVTDIALLEKQFKAELKDFGDVANVISNKLEIEKATIPAFSFLLDQKYFKDHIYDANTIHNVFHRIQEDQLLTNSFQNVLLEEYLINRSSFSKEDLQDIFYPKAVEQTENPLDLLKQVALKQYLSTQAEHQLQNDQTKLDFYKAHRSQIDHEIWNVFIKDTDHYLDQSGAVNLQIILDHCFDHNKEFKDYTILHDFQYEEAFTQTYSILDSNSSNVKLNAEQKAAVIDQYNNSLSDDEKLNLGEITEIHIINQIEDLKKILPELMNPLLRDAIEDKMLTSQSVQYFKFSTIFDQAMLQYVDSKFLNTKKDNFKNILLVNNLENQLKLTEDNYISIDHTLEHQEEQLDQEEPALQKEDIADKTNVRSKEELKILNDRTQDRILFSKDLIIKSTEKGFALQTSDPHISIFVPKHLCYWKDENMTHLYVIPKTKAFSRTVTTLSKYVDEEYQGRITIDELKDITKFIEIPLEKPSTMDSIDLKEAAIKFKAEYAYIPARLQEQNGFLKVSKNYIDGTTLKGKPDFEYSFYNEQHKFVEKCSFKDISTIINNRTQFDLQNELRQDFEMEGF